MIVSATQKVMAKKHLNMEYQKKLIHIQAIFLG
jgi:hypothetical protein